MTRVHVLPCGTSILRNLETGVPGCQIMRTQVEQMKRWACDELVRDQPAGQWSQTFDRDVRLYLPLLQATQDRVRLSAESASLVRYQAQVREDLQPDDLIVLLSSDTPDGMLAALLVAAALDRGTRVHPAPALDSSDRGQLLTAPDAEREPVHVVRIPQLLPDSTTRFTQAMAGMAQAVLWAVPAQVGSGFVMHLSGGYKATLPYLLVMGEYLKALQPPVEAFCLHEGDPDSSARPDLVEIFLRSVDLRADIADLKRARAGQQPGARLRDFAYREVDGKFALTDVGVVLSRFQFYLGDGP